MIVAAPGVGLAATHGTLTGVVVAEREDVDGDTELLLATPAAVEGNAIDEILLEVPSKLAKKITVSKLPPGWTMSSHKGTVTLSGSPVTSADTIAIALGADPRLLPDSIGIELVSGGRTVMGGDAHVQELPRVEKDHLPADAAAVPEILTPGESMSFVPLDPALTPPGGTWTINGEPAEWNGSFEDAEYTWTPPLEPAKWPVDGLSIEYTDPWGNTLVDGSAEISFSDPDGETSDEPRITGCSPEVLTGATFCVCGTFPDEATRRGITLDGQSLGTPLSSARHVLKFRLPEGLAPGPFTIAGERGMGYDESDTASGIHIAVGGEIDRERLRSGESTPLRLWLEGTDKPVSLRLWNSTPAIISLEGGEDQVVTTSGGAPNQVERVVHAVSPGDFVLSYELELGSCPCAEDYELQIASLITPVIQFAAGQEDRLIWLRVPAPGMVELRSPQQLAVEVFDGQGTPVRGEGVDIAESESDPWYRTVVDFRQTGDLFYLGLERTGDLEEQIDVLVMLDYDDPEILSWYEETPGERFFSPYRRFPSGKEADDIVAAQSALSLDDAVEEKYGYSIAMGTTFLSYVAMAALTPHQCPQFPVVGPSPPDGAECDDNYCAISAFIHSMITNYTNVFAGDPQRDPADWDEVGKYINHNQYFGTPACHLIAGVNKNYFFGRKADNGERYCAWELKNTSIQNLRAWEKECDVKILIYDYKRGWAHWVPIVNIEGRVLQVQDYDISFAVTYISRPKSQLDFRRTREGSLTRGHFDKSNPIAGDETGESVHFVAVCECDDSWVETERVGECVAHAVTLKVIRPPKGLKTSQGWPMLP